MNDDFRSFGRVGYFFNDTLLEISIDSFLKFELIKNEVEKFKKKDHFYNNDSLVNEKINELENLLLKESIKVVIFLGAFLESYFFELSAVALGQQFTEKHIDRLDLASKIIIIPRLISGKEINTSLNFWSEIKNLIKWRNKIIHNKTKNFAEFINNVNPDEYNPKPLYKEYDMLKFIKSIKVLFKELDSIDTKSCHTLRIKRNMKRIFDK